MQTNIQNNAVSRFFKKRLTATTITITTFMFLMITTVCIFWFTMTQALGNYLNQQTDVLGSSLATQAAFNATQSILTNDLLSLNILLSRLVVDDNILSARVFNKKDELLAEADSNNTKHPVNADFRPSKDHRIYTSSIRFRNEVVGHVLITLDKTPAQNTLKHLTSLLIGVAIFICSISLLLILLMTRWLFTPIKETRYALKALIKGHQDAFLPSPIYKEARQLCATVHQVQALEWPKTMSLELSQPEETIPTAPQLEIDFEKIFAESKHRSCVLYIDLVNIKEWHNSMTPLEVANLLTPIYRAIFQASEQFKGQVHQYQNDSVLILFNAEESGDNLYIEAICAAHVIIGLIEKLLENELYYTAPALNCHLGIHKGTAALLSMMKENHLDIDKIKLLLEDIQLISTSSSLNKVIISEDVFTMNDIQNRVFTSLPEIIETDDKEILAYEVKGIVDKYKKRVQQYIANLTHTENADTKK